MTLLGFIHTPTSLFLVLHLTSKDKTPDGGSVFIAAQSNAGLKKDYVYGVGSFGRGYYSLLTRDAYKNLHSRLESEAPGGGCCGGGSDTKEAYDEWDTVKRIVFKRTQITKPDDNQDPNDYAGRSMAGSYGG